MIDALIRQLDEIGTPQAQRQKEHIGMLAEWEHQLEHGGNMTPLQDLAERCAGPVHIAINEHRTYRMSVPEALGEGDERVKPARVPKAVWARMLEADQAVVVQFYPNDADAMHEVMHADVEEAIDEALTWCIQLQSVVEELATDEATQAVEQPE